MLHRRLGLEVQTSDWVTQDSGEGEFANPRVRAAAFESAVLDEDLNSEVIEASDEVLIAMHKNEFEAQHIKAFDEVAAQIETLIKNRKASDIAKNNGETLIDELKQGSSLQSIAFDKLPELRENSTSLIERQIATQVFKQKLPVAEVLIDGFSLNNGDYAVYRLKGITPGNPEEATREQRDQITSQLEGRDGNSAYLLFREGLRNDADIEIFSSALEDDSDILAVQ